MSSRRHSRNAKLTAAAVLDIWRRGRPNPPGDRYHYEGWSQSELARMHGVSKALVAQILQGRAWADVTSADDERDD